MKILPLTLLPPLLGMALLTLGNGFFGTLTTLQLQSMQHSVWAIGWVSTLYFSGMIIGSYFAQNLIVRMRYSKAYLVFALSLATAALLQGFIPQVWLWAITRAVSAFCLAGMFIVTDSWLLAAVEDRQKGQIMAISLLSYYTFQAASQLFLKIRFPQEWMAFALIAALACLSILPIIFAKQAAPLEHNKLASPRLFFKKAPFGLSAGLVAGLMFAMVYTMFPLFLSEAGLSPSKIANVMSVTLIGGALLQLPIGKISDSFDRRKVLASVALGIAIIALLMACSYQNYAILLALSFIFGGFIFAIYPLSISHTSDYVGKALAVSAVSIITLIYSAGSMIGPLLMSAFMSGIGKMGFFAYSIISCGALGLYGIYSVVKYQAVQPQHFEAKFPEEAIGENQIETKPKPE
ncbi:MAG: transporter [Gammaproteobacteria bacterium]|jgi:MFS family permease|nr:transporter [Gammaproteobacteria bacterium]